MKPVFRCLRVPFFFCLAFSCCAKAQNGFPYPQNFTLIDQYDSVFFDLSQAACSGSLAQFPVWIKSDDPVYALDFSLRFDLTKMAFHSIVVHQGYLMAAASYNSADSTLRFTSSSMTLIDNLIPLVSVRFTLLNGGQINAGDLNFKTSLLNGTSCSRKVMAGPVQPAINPAGILLIDPGDSITLSVISSVNSSFLWSTGAVTDSIVVYNSGNYSVTVTTQAGCSMNLSASVQFTSPLPVSLLAFTVKMNSTVAVAEWITASEVNNDFFTVERSADGKRFESIAIVDGAGNSTQILKYHTTDNAPLKGISFYRLRQTDFDGRFTYSQVVSISNFNVADGAFMLFPNPANHFIHIYSRDFSALEEGNYSATLTDVSGKVMKRMEVESVEQRMDVSQLPDGVYFMRIMPATSAPEQKTFLQRVVVMH